MALNAITVERYRHANRPLESFDAGEKTKEMIIKLARILDQLEPHGDDNLHTVWISVKRPTFRQFYDCYYESGHPYAKAGKRIIARSEKDYEESFPDTKVWHRLSVSHFSRSPEEEFYALFIDNGYVFSINDCNRRETCEGTDLLEWALKESGKVIEKVRNGTYKTDVLDKIPYRFLWGKIKRKDLWEASPEDKKNFFSWYNKKEIKKFLKYFGPDKPDNPPLEQMTARTFYEACAVIYRALGRKRENATYRYEENESEYERYKGDEQTPKEMYYANADGRDNGLMNVPMDDPEAFAEWMNKKGPYYEFNGSHPWEIIPSMSVSFSLHLYPHKNPDGTYCFALSGESEVRAPETITAANALYEAGYPVIVYGLEHIQDRLAGNDIIDIVPASELCWRDDSTHLPEGKEGAEAAKKVSWHFHEYKLREETGTADTTDTAEYNSGY